MTADYDKPLTLPAWAALSEAEQRQYNRAYALAMIEHRRGAAAAEEYDGKSDDEVLVAATGVGDPGVAATLLMKIYEAEAAATIPDWERRLC